MNVMTEIRTTQASTELGSHAKEEQPKSAQNTHHFGRARNGDGGVGVVALLGGAAEQDFGEEGASGRGGSPTTDSRIGSSLPAMAVPPCRAGAAACTTRAWTKAVS